MADFSGSDPIIYREPLQTEQYDSLSLNGKLIRYYYIFLLSSFFHSVNFWNGQSQTFTNKYHFLLLLLQYHYSAPNFVSSITKGDFVYFFFRETAVEYINCGKVSSYSNSNIPEKVFFFVWLNNIKYWIDDLRKLLGLQKLQWIRNWWWNCHQSAFQWT